MPIDQCIYCITASESSVNLVMMYQLEVYAARRPLLHFEQYRVIPVLYSESYINNVPSFSKLLPLDLGDRPLAGVSLISI